MMCYKFIVFYFIFAAARVRSDDDKRPLNPCIYLLMPPVFEQFCCKSLGTLEEVIQKEFKTECKLEHGPWTCKDSTCIMEKEGLLENGKVSEAKFNAMMVKNTKDYPDSKNMTDVIRASCLNGKYEKYPEKGCEPMQLHMCTYMNALKGGGIVNIQSAIMKKTRHAQIILHYDISAECRSWKDSDECKAVSVTAEKCRAVFDKVIKQNYT